MDVNKLLNPTSSPHRSEHPHHYYDRRDFGAYDGPSSRPPLLQTTHIPRTEYKNVAYQPRESISFTAVNSSPVNERPLHTLANLAERSVEVGYIKTEPTINHGGYHVSGYRTPPVIPSYTAYRTNSASSASSSDSLESLSYRLHSQHPPTQHQQSVPAYYPSPGPSPLPSPPAPYDPTDLSLPPRCSYCPDCTTKSPLRKVVSHIFGRNKAETRAIPKNVWVYYCRKHYQRSRYRNPKGFAVLQCSLVRRQIERLEAWGGVESWSVKVRAPKGGKKNEDEEEVGSDVEEMDSSAAMSEDDRAWLRPYEGTQKSMAEIRALLEIIEAAVDIRGGTFPDVELLPHCFASPAEEEDTENAWMKESHRRKNGPRGSSGRRVKNKGGVEKRKAGDSLGNNTGKRVCEADIRDGRGLDVVCAPSI